MDNRTLVKIELSNNHFTIHYVRRDIKSPIFLENCSALLRLQNQPIVIMQNINSFLTCVKDEPLDRINLTFTWLDEEDDRLVGWHDWVSIPYSKLMAFIRAGIQRRCPTVGRFLSLKPDEEKHPHIIFCETDRLQECLFRDDVRRKLIRFLRDRFQWPGSEEIRFYNYSVPYSFIFQEIRNGEASVTGGLVLHGQEDMAKAYYSIHT